MSDTVQPQANPPVIVGELTDVPAPGSPIASQWAQEVSNRVVQRFASKAALDTWAAANGAVAWTTDTNLMWHRIGGAWTVQPGAIIKTQFFDAGGLTYTTTGMRDILTMSAGVVPCACRANVQTVTHFGYASGQVNAAQDLWGYQQNGVVQLAGAPMVAVTGGMTSISQLIQLQLSAGQDSGAKVRFNITAMTGTCYVYCWGIVTIIAI